MLADRFDIVTAEQRFGPTQVLKPSLRVDFGHSSYVTLDRLPVPYLEWKAGERNSFAKFLFKGS